MPSSIKKTVNAKPVNAKPVHVMTANAKPARASGHTPATALAVAPRPSALPAAPHALPARRGGYDVRPVSNFLAAFPGMTATWSFQSASCHNGGFHRIAVLNPASGKRSDLGPWVIRPSAKTGDCWVRLMGKGGAAVGRDVCFRDLQSAKAYVEKELVAWIQNRAAILTGGNARALVAPAA